MTTQLTPKPLIKTFLLLLALVATGCQMVMHIPHELAFEAKPVMNDVQIKWISATDPTKECKRLFPDSMSSYRIIAACAGWDQTTNTCVVVTGSQTSHQVLGHEVRHCFEGNFHQ
jgi:hypothetical protein